MTAQVSARLTTASGELCLLPLPASFSGERACSDDLESTLGVMAVLVTASRAYSTCCTQLVRTSGKPEVRCHPRLSSPKQVVDGLELALMGTFDNPFDPNHRL